MSALVEQHRVATPESPTTSVTESEALLRRSLERVLLAFVVAAALARVVLVGRLNVNWDEFYYLAQVHAALNGGLTNALQTFHVHLFSWLVHISPNEITQILAARGAYFALSLGSCALLYVIARQYASRAASLFSVLCYLSYSNLLEHGTSFRADGLVSFVTLGAIALIVRRRPGLAVASFAGVATGLAVLITLKSVFVVPTLLLLLVLGTWDQGGRRVAFEVLAYSIAFAIATGVGVLIQLAVVNDASADQLATYSRRAANVTFGSEGVLPGLPYLITTIGQNGFVWICIVAGLALARSSEFKRYRSLRDALALYAMVLPVLSVLVYRNSFPYFYVLLIPPVLALCALPFDAIMRRAAHDASFQRMALYLIAGVTWAFSLRFAMRLRDEVTHQRRVLAAVYEVFPEPVRYIDRSSFVASYPKVGFFMTTWGMRTYLEQGDPIFEKLLTEQKPVFLIANSPALVLSPADTAYAGAAGYALFAEDRRVLRENFVHHWGPIHVAGKRIALSDTAVAIRVLIAGTYTVEADGPVTIDGVTYSPGTSVDVTAGPHTFANDGQGRVVTMRWGRSLRRPKGPAPQRRLFVGF